MNKTQQKNHPYQAILQVEELRNELHFNTIPTTTTTRNNIIKNIALKLSPDICTGCGTEKTSTNAKTGRQNFEMHHYIPLMNNPSALDNIDNLVKLCPTCHSTLRRNRAKKQEQIDLCLIILDSSEYLYDFVSSYLSIDDKEEIAKTIQKMLL